MYEQEYDYDEYAYDDMAMDGGPAVMGATDAADAGVGDMSTEARTMAVKEVLDMQASVVDEVARLTCLSASAATLLLGDYFWSKETAIERYFEDPDGVLEKLSLTPSTASHTNMLQVGKGNSNVVCDICALDYPPAETYRLSSCQHYFCRECWQDHIKAHVHNNLLATRCPSQHCNEVVGICNMVQLFGNGGATAEAVLKNIYREYLSTFVQSCSSLYWCPNPTECSGIIHVEVPPLQGQGVTCDVCHGTFCLRCASDPHRPATCDNMRKWRQHCSAEGTNIAFILVTTKRCPKCNMDIEKDGGCNHMTCKCGHQFCWVCGHDWSSHSGDYYSCKNAAGQPNPSDRPEVLQSQRFMYHYERYTLHLNSAKRDATFIDNYMSNTFVVDDTEKKLCKEAQKSDPEQHLPESTISAPEVIARIKNALVTARPVIAHAYVQMYYLKDTSSEAMMMAHRVGKLEEATETLSGKIVEYLHLSKSQLGPMLDLVYTMKSWQKVLCEA